jgi:hypothetical protein
VAERPEDPLDDEALEASTVIERRKAPEAPGRVPEAPGKVRLSPLQPLARVDTLSLGTPAPPQLRLVLPEADPIPADPPLQLLWSGIEPARSLSDPRPTGSARRAQGPAHREPAPDVAAAPRGGRRLLLVGVIGFAAGVVVRDRWQAWRSPPPPVAQLAVAPAVLPSPPLVVEPPAPPAAAPAPALPRGTAGQKRKRGRSF